jgi:hypothetical protein
VYAIEASEIANVAEQVIRANGLSDRITVLRGWSTHVDLPERADILVSEMIGNEPAGAEQPVDRPGPPGRRDRERRERLSGVSRGARNRTLVRFVYHFLLIGSIIRPIQSNLFEARSRRYFPDAAV